MEIISRGKSLHPQCWAFNLILGSGVCKIEVGYCFVFSYYCLDGTSCNVWVLLLGCSRLRCLVDIARVETVEMFGGHSLGGSG